LKNFVRNEDPPGKLGVEYEYSEVSHKPRHFEVQQPKFFIPPTLINEIDEDNYSQIGSDYSPVKGL
jgi:hypothetical protein